MRCAAWTNGSFDALSCFGRALLRAARARSFSSSSVVRRVPGVEGLVDQRLVDLRALLGVEQRREPRALRLGRAGARGRARAGSSRGRACGRSCLAKSFWPASARGRSRSWKPGLRSASFFARSSAHRVKRQRGAEQPRAAERDAAVEVDARRALLLGEELLELVDRRLVRLVAGLRRPRLDLLVERRPCAAADRLF